MSDRGSEIIYRAENVPVRFFKACRWCRRQKMRCDARSQVPCFRCRSTGRDCILDPIDDGRRRHDRRRKTTTPARWVSILLISATQTHNLPIAIETKQLHHRWISGPDFILRHRESKDFLPPTSKMAGLTLRLTHCLTRRA